MIKNLPSNPYYILRISFLIDEFLLLKSMFKKHFITAFFRIFKIIHRYYNYDMPFAQYKLIDKFKFNIVSIIAGYFTSSKVPFRCFEVCKKVDDIIFISKEIKGRLRTSKKNLLELAYNSIKIFLKLFVVLNFLFFLRVYLYNTNLVFDIANTIFMELIIRNIFAIIKMLRYMDDIMISGYRIWLNYRMLKSFLFKATEVKMLSLNTLIVYNSIFAILKISRKILEIVIFFTKITKKMNEISELVLKKIETFETGVIKKQSVAKNKLI